MSGESGESCRRVRLKIHNENYYITVGKDFFHVTCPRENDPNMKREREALEIVSQAVNKILKKFSEEDK